LDANKKYSVVDYVNDKNLGTINRNQSTLKIAFKENLLIEVREMQ
jgi:hypothetical protein